MIPLSKSLTPAEYHDMVKPKRHKYNVAPKEQRTYGGLVFDSALEMRYAQLLDVWELAGAVKAWWPQVTFLLHAPGGVKVGAYILDFKVLYEDGHLEYVECKGFDVPLGKWKRKHCEIEHGIKVTVVKKIA